MTTATSTHRSDQRSSLGRRPQIATVCIVDQNPADYAAWGETATTLGINLVVLDSATAALRQARSSAVDLWVVNAALPGLSGIELCGLLRTQSPATPVYLVCDEYSCEIERAAWAARATMFACKGAHAGWLAEWATLCGIQSTPTESQLA